MFCTCCGRAVDNSFTFCSSCGNRIENNTFSEADEDQLLKHYFEEGYSYDKILMFLSKYHDIQFSMRTLQERLYRLGLKRRNVNFDIAEIRQRVTELLNGPGC